MNSKKNRSGVILTIVLAGLVFFCASVYAAPIPEAAQSGVQEPVVDRKTIENDPFTKLMEGILTVDQLEAMAKEYAELKKKNPNLSEEEIDALHEKWFRFNSDQQELIKQRVMAEGQREYDRINAVPEKEREAYIASMIENSDSGIEQDLGAFRQEWAKSPERKKTDCQLLAQSCSGSKESSEKMEDRIMARVGKKICESVRRECGDLIRQ